jgi:hypothetical protein
MGGKDVHAIQDVYFIPRSGFRVTPLASQFSGVHPDLVWGDFRQQRPCPVDERKAVYIFKTFILPCYFSQ